ncbi:MAG TPA: hypothetical protein V6D07_18895 [Trichocoleus sp.]
MRISRVLEAVESALKESGLSDKKRAELLLRIIQEVGMEAEPITKIDIPWEKLALASLKDPKRRRPHSATLSIYHFTMLLVMAEVSGNSLGGCVQQAVEEYVRNHLDRTNDELLILKGASKQGVVEIIQEIVDRRFKRQE